MVRLALWHEATEKVSGMLEIKAYGDVVGAGGRDNNADIHPLEDVPPGKDAQTVFPYYMSNPVIQKNPDMSPDEAGRNAGMAILVRYIPQNWRSPWREHTWLCACRDGELRMFSADDLPPEWAAWMAELGVDSRRLTAPNS